MAVKGGRLAALSLRNLGRTEDGAHIRAEVAAGLIGAPAIVARHCEVRAGADNIGITVYRCTPASGAEGPAYFLQKQTRSTREYRTARALADAGIATVLPRIYGTAVGRLRFSLMMEWWDNAETLDETWRCSPEALARSVHRLGLDLAPLAKAGVIAESERYFAALTGRFEAHLRDVCGIRPPALAQARLALADLPRVVSHDDLNPLNAVTLEGDPRGVGFIDLGGLRVNAAGSAFQRLAIDAVAGGETRLLLDAAEAYERLTGLARNRVLFAAHFYAASRQLNRAINKSFAAPFDQPARHIAEALRYL